MRSQLLLLAAALTCACSPAAPPQPKFPTVAPLGSIQIQPGYFANDGKPIENGSLPREIGVRGLPIPGNIFGSPVFPAVISQNARIGEVGVLDLLGAESEVSKLATPLTDEGTNAGLRSSPREVRLVRIGIFAVNADTGKGGLGYTSLKGVSTEVFSIVYFDRPCTLSGVVQSEGKTVNVALQIPNPGFHLLSIAQVSPTTYSVTLSEVPSVIVLSITPQKKVVLLTPNPSLNADVPHAGASPAQRAAG